MLEYARQRGLRRWLVPVPLLTPRLSSALAGISRPSLYARVGRKLIEGLRNPTIVRDPAARQVFRVEPMDMPTAIARAMRNEDRDFASDPVVRRQSRRRPSSHAGEAPGSGRGSWTLRSRDVEVPASRAFTPVRRIGRETRLGITWTGSGGCAGGWTCSSGGSGCAVVVATPSSWIVGDALDWWRVEVYEPGRRLRLAAEMKLPGRTTWLEFEVEPRGDTAATDRDRRDDLLTRWG